MNVIYFLGEETKENHVYEIQYEHKSCYSFVDFKIIQYSGGEEYDPFDLVCTGSIKWDGCSNWIFNKQIAFHLCGLQGLDEFNSCIKKCYEIAKGILGDDCE